MARRPANPPGDGNHTHRNFDRSMVTRAAEMLARAFMNDAIFTSHFTDEAKRSSFAKLFMRFPLHLGLAEGEVHATSDVPEGIAVWYPPDTWPMSSLRQVRAIPLRDAVRFVLSGGARMAAFGDALEKKHAALAPAGHWYLQLLGVAPEHQGRGFASALLCPMLSRIDDAGRTAYLETTNTKNVGMYEHFGFEVVDHFVVPPANIECWSMVRQPGTIGGCR